MEDPIGGGKPSSTDPHDAGGKDTQDSGEAALRITYLLPGGAAEVASLGVGDLIVSIGGKRVGSFDEMVAAVSGAEGPVEVVFVKDGGSETESVTLTPDKGKLGVAVETTPIKFE